MNREFYSPDAKRQIQEAQKAKNGMLINFLIRQQEEFVQQKLKEDPWYIEKIKQANMQKASAGMSWRGRS